MEGLLQVSILVAACVLFVVLSLAITDFQEWRKAKKHEAALKRLVLKGKV